MGNWQDKQNEPNYLLPPSLLPEQPLPAARAKRSLAGTEVRCAAPSSIGGRWRREEEQRSRQHQPPNLRTFEPSRWMLSGQAQLPPRTGVTPHGGDNGTPVSFIQMKTACPVSKTRGE